MLHIYGWLNFGITFCFSSSVRVLMPWCLQKVMSAVNMRMIAFSQMLTATTMYLNGQIQACLDVCDSVVARAIL